MNRLILLFASIIIFIGGYASTSQSNTLLAIDLIIISVVALTIPKKDLIAFTSILIAPNRILTLGFISGPLVVVIIGFLRYISQKKIPNRIIVLSIIFLLYSIICVYFVHINILLSIKTIIAVIFLYYAFIFSHRKIVDTLVLYISTGCIATTLILLVINPESLFENQRMTFSASGQNVLGIICGVMAVMMFIKIITSSHKSLNLLVGLTLILLIGFLTGSRTFLLEFAVGIFLFILYTFTHTKNGNASSTIIFLLIVSIIFYTLISSSGVLSNFLDFSISRFNKMSDNDVSNGRFELWLNYIALFSNEPKYLFLGGVEAEKAGVELVAHNMLIEQLAGIGIIGSIIVFFLYREIFLSIKNHLNLIYKINLSTIAPLLSFLIASLVGHSLLGLPQTLLLFACLFNLTRKK